MKKTISLLFVCFTIMSCNSGIEGEGVATAEHEMAVDIFQNLIVNCNCDLNLIPAENTKVVVESHQNLIDNLNIKSKNKSLEITENTKVGKFSLYNVNVYFNPELTKIELKNQTRMKISGTLKADEILIKLADNTMLDKSFVDIREMKIQQSGNSRSHFSGTVIDLIVETSDNANAELEELQAVSVNFKTYDNSMLSIYPMKEMNGRANDNSMVRYKGDPVKDNTTKDRAVIEKK